ncbi:hypothetical protein J6590_001873 [Homalodisca vitripennis]|nr:hypothetical protein J6590_001873 [Homalodisca vitripennis]
MIHHRMCSGRTRNRSYKSYADASFHAVIPHSSATDYRTCRHRTPVTLDTRVTGDQGSGLAESERTGPDVGNITPQLCDRGSLRHLAKWSDGESHSLFANLNPLPALEAVIELGGLPVKRQKLVNDRLGKVNSCKSLNAVLHESMKFNFAIVRIAFVNTLRKLLLAQAPHNTTS